MSVYEDLVRELEADPAKREALRAILLSEELLALPATVATLAAEVRALSDQVAEMTRIMAQVLARLDRIRGSRGDPPDRRGNPEGHHAR